MDLPDLFCIITGVKMTDLPDPFLLLQVLDWDLADLLSEGVEAIDVSDLFVLLQASN